MEYALDANKKLEISAQYMYNSASSVKSDHVSMSKKHQNVAHNFEQSRANTCTKFRARQLPNAKAHSEHV